MTIGKDFTGKAETEMKKFSEKMAKDVQAKKRRSLDELRQTKDSIYIAPNDHDKNKEELVDIDWIKIGDIDNYKIPSNIMVWQENLTDPGSSRFQRGSYFDGDGDDGFIQIYPHSDRNLFKKDTHYIASDLEGDTCQITHFALVDSPNKA